MSDERAPAPAPGAADDETRAVARRTAADGAAADAAVDDETRAVSRVPDDETRAVSRSERGEARPVDDATQAVRREPGASGRRAAPERAELAPVRVPVADDATRAVRREPEDETRVVPAPRSEGGEPRPSDEATVVVPAAQTGGQTTGTPAPPIAEPEDRRDLSALMFKPPLDPRRRARRSPFPQPEHTLPRRGVRPGMPVVYGARPEHVGGSVAGLDPDSPLAVIGPPPEAPGNPPAAAREGLRSTARQNRVFSAIALGGGTAVVLGVAAGLWWIGRIAFG